MSAQGIPAGRLLLAPEFKELELQQEQSSKASPSQESELRENQQQVRNWVQAEQLREQKLWNWKKLQPPATEAWLPRVSPAPGSVVLLCRGLHT